jgi:hypothetical protein
MKFFCDDFVDQFPTTVPKLTTGLAINPARIVTDSDAAYVLEIIHSLPLK